VIRDALPGDVREICEVINDGASAYKGVIPDDRWHDPYMSLQELQDEITAGVRFACYTVHEDVVGVMGTQDKGAVVLIRHAYVRSAAQGEGIGTKLLLSLLAGVEKPVLIGTWKAADWAIRFYEKHGFRIVPDAQARDLLRTFWNIPARQLETSVVLADEASIARGLCDYLDR